MQEQLRVLQRQLEDRQESRKLLMNMFSKPMYSYDLAVLSGY